MLIEITLFGLTIYSNIKTEGNSWVKAESELNMELFCGLFEIQNSQLKTVTEKFSLINNKFINAYNACDKDTFAKNLKTNSGFVKEFGVTSSSSKEQIATSYFNEVYGI